MSSGTRILLKVLVAVVSYGVTLALTIYGVTQLLNGDESLLAIIVLIIIAIFGFGATKGLPFFYASGGGTESIPITLFLLALRIVFSLAAGVLVAPWKIAKKLTSLIPGEKAEEE